MSRLLTRALALLVALPLIGSGSAPAVAPTAGASGVGDPYFVWDGNGGYDVEHYDINATMRLGKRKLNGRTTVTARATQALSSFRLDLVLPARAVSVDGVRADFNRPNDHELLVVPATTIAEGDSFEVTVRYAGRPGRVAWKGERPWLGNRHEVVTMGEPHMAPWWFPANDHPSDKARFDITVRVPRGNTVVANGRRVSAHTKGNWSTFHWRARDEMATYLAFFAAGDFTVRTSTERGLHQVVAVSKRLGAKSRTRSLSLAGRSARVVRWLEEWLGPYPFETTGAVVTALDTGFALENQTRPTYPDLRHQSNYLLAHELAHQWFGDKVSVRRWSDIWINEGFATWLGLACQTGCRSAGMGRWLRDMWTGIPRGASFWKVVVSDPGPGRLFHGAVYDRGAMAVQALRNRIGAVDFHALLRAWVTDRDHGSVEEFRDLAEEISGEDLNAFFTAWLDTPSRPARTAANGWLAQR